MKCTYELNGQKFSSELELDEYLLKVSPYLSTIGDIVFEMKEHKAFVYNRLREASKKAKEIPSTKVRVRNAKEIENKEIIEDEPMDLDKLISLDTENYITITDLIRSMSTIEDYQLTPVFNSDEYWSRAQVRFADINNFNEGEFYHDLVPYIFDKNPDGTYDIHSITDTEEFKKVRERVEFVWKTQSLIGTAIHDVLSSMYIRCPDHDPFKLPGKEVLKEKITNYFKDNKQENLKYIGDKMDVILDACIEFNNTLKKKYGKGCMVIPEMQIQCQGKFGKNNAAVVGRLDLTIITEDGDISIVDFKCSPKEYKDYNKVKIRTFDYQLASYRRMLIDIGLISPKHKEKCSLFAVPIKFDGFRYNKDSNKCEFDKISFEGKETFKELTVSSSSLGGVEYNKVETNLDQVFVPKYEELVDTNSLLNNVNEELDILFPKINTNSVIDDSYVADYIEQKGGFKKTDDGYDFYWRKNPRYHSDILHGKTEEGLTEKIKGILISRQLRVGENTESIIKNLRIAQNKGDRRLFKWNSKYYRGGGNKEYTQDRLQKYADDNWEILDLPESYLDILSSLGVILLKSKATNQIDIVKISNKDLETRINLGKNRNTLFGTFLDDTSSMNNNTQIKPLENFSGNVDLILVMSVLNQMPSLMSDKIIGNIQVINPELQEGFQITNKQLLYNYSTLLRLSKRQNNFYYAGNGVIKMASYLDLAREKLREILYTPYDSSDIVLESKAYDKLKGYIPRLDEANTDYNDKYTQLDLLRKDMENEFGALLDDINMTLTEKNENEDPKYTLYRYVLMAMGELKGITYTQQVEEHEAILDGQISQVLAHGWNGTRIDNPGSLKNDNLNKLAELTMQQYDKVRQDLIRVNYKVRELTRKLKEDKNFGVLSRYTFGNQTSMYKNMYNEEMWKNNELYFKNPWDLNDRSLLDSEREYLKYAILTINMQRYRGVSEQNIEELIANNPDDYLRVPLAKGDFGARSANNGNFLNGVRNKFKRMDISERIQTIEGRNELKEEFKTRLKRQFQNVYDPESEKSIEDNLQWEMISSFQRGEKDELRKEDLKKFGVEYFETNLEKLILKHTQATSAKEHLDTVFPLFKSIMLHISNQGIIKNEQFTKDLTYAQDFIKSKIFNYPLDDVNKWGLLQLSARKLMQTTSKIALWMNPRQLYQGLDGIWKDVSLYIKNPDGKESFTKKNLTEAALWVYQDIGHFGDSFSIAELLNMTYGLNDMDANTLADRMHQDTAGFYNIESLGFRFSSRPDYFNRLTIFGAQMKGDGCFDAHSKVDGKLVYNWKLDKRFDKFANWTEEQFQLANYEQKQEYNKQKALYFAMAKEFMESGFKNPDGTPFVFDPNKKNPLPRAYTNRQAESMKELADRIYGYYSHEKRSLIQSGTIGAMFFQMFTYASSRKNQYISGRIYNQEGEYEHYYDVYIDDEGKEQKNYWYEVLNNDGTTTVVDQNHLPEDPNKYIPLMQWRGRPCEGAIVTLVRLMQIAAEGDPETGEKGIYAIIHNIQNVKEAERALYRNNLGQLLYDLIGYGLIGLMFAPVLVSEAKNFSKDLGEDNYMNAFLGMCATLGAEWVYSSAEDFNLWKSLGGRGLTWTPFSLSTLQRVGENFGKVLTGQRDVYDAFIKTYGATKATEPIWNVVKLDALGREIGDNGNE